MGKDLHPDRLGQEEEEGMVLLLLLKEEEGQLHDLNSQLNNQSYQQSQNETESQLNIYQKPRGGERHKGNYVQVNPTNQFIAWIGKEGKMERNAQASE